MGDVVNLNRLRKAKARDDKASKAAANRALHGRTKAQRAADAAVEARRAALLDGARLDGEKRDA
ncbi:hypothetical protein ASG29_01635 [Sphingomonas sp. Leaf412]|uniref:DUF4169 family protein n=1 Tax=Sphingomonas sp. Leaf412 TaxID=1736370 RepID=UPI0006FA468F|nr:DUF4169 family protein [Sphingomonas sp. Leaf412]KQT34882.1 hypothetical protein ASG29_01635 [Sphingomonas sp. Leaf412]